MKIETAADSLLLSMKPLEPTGYASVGIGENDSLVVYIEKGCTPVEPIPEDWGGFKVIVKEIDWPAVDIR